MDPALLIDPVFWGDGASVAMGAFDGELPDEVDGSGLVFFQTSGSSGEPKWIGLTKSGLLISAAAVNGHLGVTEDSCWGLALPCHHVGGFGVVARVFEAGCGHVVFPGRWDAGRFRDWVAEEGVSHVSLVPTQVHDLVAAGLTAPDGLVAVVAGGGRLAEETGRAARGLGWPVLASYGMTEAGSQVATQGLGLLDVPYEMGRLPILPHWRVGVNDEGLLRLAGPALFDGVLERVGGRWRFVKRVGEWFETRDRVLLDGGVLTPMGRWDGVVKIFGELVDPELVERELAVCAEGGLVEGRFCVVAVADERAGHRLRWFIEGDFDREWAMRVRERYHGSVPGFLRVGEAEGVEVFPRSPLGKILRREIVRK